jgi:4-hydroxy-tetrahydrodipicolinate synthase
MAASDIVVLCGDDALTLPMMALGARGVVSVASNLLPARVRALVAAAARGDVAAAAAAHHGLVPVCRALFCETNPGPAKLAMHWARLLPCAAMRLPLAPVDAANHARIRAVVDGMAKDECGPAA